MKTKKKTETKSPTAAPRIQRRPAGAKAGATTTPASDLDWNSLDATEQKLVTWLYRQFPDPTERRSVFTAFLNQFNAPSQPFTLN